MSDREEKMGRLADRAKRKQPTDEDTTSDSEQTENDASEESESETADKPEGEDTAEPRHMRDRPAVFMYLPEAYANKLDLACQMINLTYQQETGEELPKNRYLYPIVTKVGFETAAELDFEEIQVLKDEIDEIDAEEAKADD